MRVRHNKGHLVIIGVRTDMSYSGGTCGPVIAGRLSEDSNASILVLEAGMDSADMDSMHMAGAYVSSSFNCYTFNILQMDPKP